MKKPRVPGHLSPRSADFWREIVSKYELEPPHLEVFRRCCEAMDRADAAIEVIEAEGLTFRTKYQEIRPHPAVAIERDARLAVSRLLEQLKLGEEPPASKSERGSEAAREKWKRRTGT